MRTTSGRVVKWVDGGPEIPAELVEAAEDGQLVFFCGAGISMRADLPNFGGLVNQVYKRLPRNRKDHRMEATEFRRKNYDRVLGLIEAGLGDVRHLLRNKVAQILELRRKADCQRQIEMSPFLPRKNVPF